MESRLRLLGEKAGPVLFQLPPQFKKDTARLAWFLEHRRGPRPYVSSFATPVGIAPTFLSFLMIIIVLCASRITKMPLRHGKLRLKISTCALTALRGIIAVTTDLKPCLAGDEN